MPSVVTVESVQAIQGTSKKTGKLFTKYVLHAGGREYGTFDGQLAELLRQNIGARVEIDWEQGAYGNDLKSAKPSSAGEDFRAVTPEGAVDWDLKDIRINRCAFWKELLGPVMDGAVRLYLDAHPGEGQANLAVFARNFGTTLRMIAEADIYSSREPAGVDDWLPFLKGGT